MNWINDLLWGEGIGHSILLLSFVIAAGIQLGKIKVFGVSLGITLVLFVGNLLGHFGFTINHNVIHFFKEFGLILFVLFCRYAGRTGFLFFFQTRRDYAEYAGVRYCVLRCLDGCHSALCDRYSDADNGRNLVGCGNEYTGIGGCPASIFRYARSV